MIYIVPLCSSGEDVSVDWKVPMGTNISCELEFNNSITYQSAICNNTGSWLFQRDRLPSEIGNYTAQLKLWNMVTRAQWRSVNIRVERELEGLNISLSHPFRALGQSSSFEVTLLGASNCGLEVEYSDNYPPSTFWYVGDVRNISQTIYRSYPLTGDVIITARVTNALMSIDTTATVEIQAPVVGLYMVETNTTSLDTPVHLMVKQSANLLRPTHVIFLIDWGDGGQTWHRDVQVDDVRNATISHLYAYEGHYTTTLTAFNNLSSQILQARVKVGEEVEGLVISMKATVVAPAERFSMCFNITHGSNVSIGAEFLPEEVTTMMDVMLPGVEECLTYTYTTQGLYTVNITAHNTFTAISKEVDVFVEEAVSGLHLVLPRGLIANDTSEVRVSFYNLGIDYCVLVNVGDGGNRYAYGVAACESKHPDHLYRARVPQETYFTVEHVFKFTGTYTANVTAYNRISRETVTESILVIFCDKPTARLNGRGRNPYLPASFYRSQAIKLDARVINPCSIPWNISMNWTVEVWPDKRKHYYYQFDQPNAPLLVIPARTLPYGAVKVTFYVKVGPYDGIEDIDYKYIKITRTPLRVSLRGGKSFALKKTSNMFIDARPFCYDPDDPVDRTSLKYRWQIRKEGNKKWTQLTNGHTEYVARRKRSLSKLDEGILYLVQSLPLGFLDIMVTVIKDIRVASYIQTVQLTAGVVLDVNITYEYTCIIE